MERLNVIGCALSDSELEARAELAGRLTPAVVGVERQPRTTRIRFGPSLDEALLLELVEREKECCAFFGFDWRAGDRELVVTVPEDRFQPSLDAVTAAVGGAL